MALISFDDDTWIPEHDACERSQRNIQSLLLAYCSESRSSPMYGQLSAEIRTKLKQCRAEVARLGETLNRTTREQIITEAEHERRFRQIETLRSKCLQMQNQFTTGAHASANPSNDAILMKAKEELFSKPSGSSAGGPKVKQVSWGTESDDEDLIQINDPPTVEQIQQKQTRMIREQDDGLEALSKIISRQRNIAENIGNEVALQNEIIDDLAEHMDRTNDQVLAETGNIRVVDRRDNTCWYWNVIILLFIAIVLIVVIG